MNECVFPIQEHETSQNWLLSVYSPSEMTEFSVVSGNFIYIKNLKALGHVSFMFLHQVPLREPTLVFCFMFATYFEFRKKSTSGTGFLNFNFDSSNGFIKIFVGKYHIPEESDFNDFWQKVCGWERWLASLWNSDTYTVIIVV